VHQALNPLLRKHQQLQAKLKPRRQRQFAAVQV
jgi:hypothetical protein